MPKSPRTTVSMPKLPWVLALLLLAAGPLVAARDPDPAAPPPTPEAEGATAESPAETTIEEPAPAPFELHSPDGWEPRDLARLTVPGEALALWSPDEVTSLAAFVQRPGEAFDAATVLERSVGAARKIRELTIDAEEVRTVAGMEAMWLVMSGPGTGGSLGRGETPTIQHWVAIPRGEQIFVFLLTTPATEYTARLAEFEAALGTLAFR